MACSHSLWVLLVAGDAKALYDFTLALSALYENLDAPAGRLPIAPSFYKHFHPSPLSYTFGSSDSVIPLMPHLAKDYTPKGLMAAYDKGEKDNEEVALRLPADSVDKMYAALRTAGADDSASTKLRPSDALTAYLITTLNRCLEEPVARVITIVNVSEDVLVPARRLLR